MLAWTVILFFLLNQVQPLYNTSFSFQRVSFFVIVLFFVCARRIPFKFDIFTIFLFLISLFLTVYSLLLSFIFDSDFIQTSRFFHFLVFSLLSPFIVCYLLKDEVRFHKAIVFASCPSHFYHLYLFVWSFFELGVSLYRFR